MEDWKSRLLQGDNSIYRLNLSYRTDRALIEAGICTVNQLRGRSESDLLKIKGLGQKGVDKIMVALGKKEAPIAKKDAERKYENTKTDFERLECELNNLSARLKELKESGDGSTRRITKTYISKRTKDFVFSADYQHNSLDEFKVLSYRMFRYISGTTMDFRGCSIRKAEDMKIEQAELAVEYINAAINLWNVYALRAAKLDAEIINKMKAERKSAEAIKNEEEMK